MSFLEPLLAGIGTAGAGAAAGGAGAAATGLGHLIGVDPGRVASIAGSIGKGMNQIAQAGGAQGGYQDPGVPAVQNHLQLLDDATLRAILQRFAGGGIAVDGGTVHPARY